MRKEQLVNEENNKISNEVMKGAFL